MIGLERPGFAGQNTGNFKIEKSLRIEEPCRGAARISDEKCIAQG
jgi:hypothetical protein